VSPTETPVSRVGELLADKYRIVRFIGEGGMGTVYEAQHAVVGRRFAVKFLHSDLAKQEEILERFKREARAAGALESEHIASVLDFGHASDGIPYIVMELLVGENLARFLAREGPLPVVRAVNIIIQACRGLTAAHAAGIIHRDLKPENLFVCRRDDGSDHIKILDFGIAKLAQAGSEGPLDSVTRTGATMGTPFYMSPEQARGAKDVDHRADVYGLGVILFEALSGQKPHPGDSYNAILYHILTQPPMPIATLRSGLPADLLEVVHRSLASDPDDRPATVMDLAQALSRHAGRQVTPIQSQFDLRVTRSSAAGPDTRPGSSDDRIGSTTARVKRSRIQWLVGGLALALAGTAAVFLLRPRGDEPSRWPLQSGPVPFLVPPSNPPDAAAAVVPSAPAFPLASPPAAPEGAAVPSSKPATVTTNSSRNGRKSAAPHPNRQSRREPRHVSPYDPVFDPRNPYH
jgi:serine/threonine protein kinase